MTPTFVLQAYLPMTLLFDKPFSVVKHLIEDTKYKHNCHMRNQMLNVSSGSVIPQATPLLAAI